jgi:hypothetical protein
MKLTVILHGIEEPRQHGYEQYPGQGRCVCISV